MPYTHTEIFNFLSDANRYMLPMWPTASHRYQRSGNSPAQRWAWDSPLVAILQKSGKVCPPLGKVSVPPGCFSQEDCWLFPPTGNFGGKPPAFRLDTSWWGQRCSPSAAISPMTRSSGGSSTTPPCCPLQPPAPCATEHLGLHFPCLWENRGGKERVSYPHLQQSTSPRLACEKGSFPHWRDLLVQPSGQHILLSAKAEVGAQCSGRAQFGQATWGKHPSKVRLRHGRCRCPQGLPGPPEALPPPVPRHLEILNSLWVRVLQMSPLQAQPVLLWGLASFPFSQGTKS